MPRWHYIRVYEREFLIRPHTVARFQQRHRWFVGNGAILEEEAVAAIAEEMAYAIKHGGGRKRSFGQQIKSVWRYGYAAYEYRGRRWRFLVREAKNRKAPSVVLTSLVIRPS